MNIENYVRTLTDKCNNIYTLEELKGGYWNRVYRYRSTLDWVIKQFNTTDDSPLYPILPDSEAKALEILAGTGLAPEFVSFDAKTQDVPVLIYEYVQGTPWEGKCEQDFWAVGELLAKLHAHPVNAADFRLLPVTGTDLIASAALMLDSIEKPPASIIQRFSDLRSKMGQGDINELEERVLVHTDCGPGNLIADSKGLCLIDWQCPGMGDPCHDLCVFLSPAMQVLYDQPPLSLKSRLKVLEGYGIEKTLLRLPLVQAYYHYQIAAYCFYRQQELKQSNPVNSDKYSQALNVELQYLEELL